MIFQGGVIFSKSGTFLLSCLAFLAGISLASFWPAWLNGLKIYWFAAGVFFLVLTVLFWRKNESGLKLETMALLLAAVLFLAFWRYGLALRADAPDKIWHYNGQELTVRARVTAEPDIRDTGQKLTVAAEGIKAAPGRKISGKILVTAGLYPEYNYGDELELNCLLKPPEEFKGFAYDRYLARYDIYSVCYYPAIKILARENAVGLEYVYGRIFALKKVLSGLIDSGLSEPAASLARPIVFGGQRGLEQAIRDDFQKVGLTHIMAVSGFNVSILAALVMAVLMASGLSRRQAFYAASLFLLAYIILVGLPASAMRAGLMGFLVLWALKLGRLNKLTNSLVLTAALLALINPKLLRDDVGFQLSFLAVAGLAYAYPILEAFWRKLNWPEFKGLNQALLITLAAQVFTLPVLALNFSQVSLIAPLANLAVLWILPLLTIVILAALPLCFIFPAGAPAFFLPALVFCRYILAVVKTLAGAPYAYLETAFVNPVWLWLYYFLAVAVIFKLRRSKLLKPEINGKMAL